MLTPRFNELWDQLTRQVITYMEFERHPSRVVELAAVRARLDDLRSSIAEERELIGAHPPRGRNRPHDGNRQRAEPGVPALLFDADLDDLRVRIVQRAVPSN